LHGNNQYLWFKKAFLVFVVSLIPVISGCTENAPPLPTVVSGRAKIPVVQSSYTWGKLGSVDYVGGADMVKGKTPLILQSGAEIKISFDYKPNPSIIIIEQFQDGKSNEVPMKDGVIKAPKEKGVYYYGVSAFWRTDDNAYSKGDTSSVFVIEVR
jgi:hypothetical protein